MHQILLAVAHNPVRPARTYLLSARCSVLPSNSDRHALVVPSVERSQPNHPLTSRGSSTTTCDIRRTARMTESSTTFTLVAGLATIFYTGWYGVLGSKNARIRPLNSREQLPGDPIRFCGTAGFGLASQSRLRLARVGLKRSGIAGGAATVAFFAVGLVQQITGDQSTRPAHCTSAAVLE